MSEILKCQVCGKEKIVSPSTIKRGTKSCSIECRDIIKRSKIYNDINKTKLCSLCKEWKPYEKFAKQEGAKTSKKFISLQSYCISCALIKSYEWAANNKQEKKKHAKRAYLKNIEKRIKYRENLTKEARDKRNKKIMEWREKNKEKVRMYNRMRHHKKRAAGILPNRFGIMKMMCYQDAKCVYCNMLLSDKYHIDHKTPISKGGGNDIENLQILCPTCNLKKATMTHEEYAERIGKYGDTWEPGFMEDQEMG